MRKPVSDADIDRLIKFCGLFGSDHGGERAEAAAKAHKLLQRSGLSWAEVFAPHLGLGAPRLAAWCARHPQALTDWERAFLPEVVRTGRATKKQRRIIEEIAGKVRAFEQGEAAA